MIRSLYRPKAAAAALMLAVAAFSGCSAGYTTDSTATVLLIIASINGGAPLKSDVLLKGGIVTDSVNLAIAVRFKNPNIATVPQIPSAVILDRYEIKYRRSDGRGVEGQDVPYSISGNLDAGFDVKVSGTDPLALEVVRAQAKFEPPLRNLENVFGGGVVVTMFADITLHGHTISNQTVTATGSLQIDFADWADQ